MVHWSRGGTYQQARPRRPFPTQRATPSPPLGSLIKSLWKYELDGEKDEHLPVAVITDCRLVASYNWLEKNQPTILLPGKPPKWAPPVTPTRLNEDNGTYFRDRNAARYPSHPIEPAISAAISEDPQIAHGIDVVACSSTLGNLLRFVRGQDKAFRILVDKIGRTVFFVRRENSPTETIPGVRGYGHTFPEAYTTWESEVRGSCSHQRVLGYKFGGLDFLVRFEADGYLGPKSGAAATGSGAGDGGSKPAKMFDEKQGEGTSFDDLVDLLTDSNVASAVPAQTKTGLTVVDGGATIAQSRIFDLKTRAAWKKKNEDTLEEEMGRLWVSQIPNFILAYHDNGTFRDIEIKDVRDRVKAWEKAYAKDLAGLVALIRRIIRAVSERSDSKLELCRMGTGPLELREQLVDAGEALSPKVKLQWVPGPSSPVLDYAESADDWQEKELEDSSSEDLDFTACSADDCGYCGRCAY